MRMSRYLTIIPGDVRKFVIFTAIASLMVFGGGLRVVLVPSSEGIVLLSVGVFLLFFVVVIALCKMVRSKFQIVLLRGELLRSPYFSDVSIRHVLDVSISNVSIGPVKLWSNLGMMLSDGELKTIPLVFSAVPALVACSNLQYATRNKDWAVDVEPQIDRGETN